MLKKLFCLLLLGSAALTANSQDSKEAPEAVSTPIALSRLVPADILLKARKPFQSKFFGRFRGPSGSDLAIHFYFQTQEKTVKIPRTPDDRYPDTFTLSKPFRLDLFEKQKGHYRWRLVISVPVRYPSLQYMNPVRFGANFTWLDDVHKTIPILILNCFDPNGETGSFGYQVSVVFPNGWAKPSVTQAFIYGGGPSSGFAGQGPRFERNADGTLQVRVSYSLNPPEEDYAEIFRWNGHIFALSETVPPVEKRMINPRLNPLSLRLSFCRPRRLFCARWAR